MCLMSEPPKKRFKSTATIDLTSKPAATRVPWAQQRRSARIASQHKRPSPPFFRLPREIRYMIFKMHFVSITGQHEDEALFEVAMGWHGTQINKLLLPKIRSDYGTYPLLNLLLVPKEFCTDAKFAFYSSMTLHCFGFEALKKMCNQKLLPGGIRQKKAQMMFSVNLVPRLILDIHGKVETKLRTLTSLWALARYSNNHLDLKLTFNGAIHVSERRMLSSTTYLKRLYAEIKCYQEQLRWAGVSLAITEKEMRSWMDEEVEEMVVLLPDTKLWMVKWRSKHG
ncbi:hypothetical protein D6D22_09131 [Aureobasidium pullulans]|uniref:Uncharacterized protein n=1 Tax=Aureobasidium pullulans TaxID=5580 RepID=A0A4S8X2L2_AURPU|nr:hypothetical protein D6D22_09131 [Aureobasidium pullulans]